MQKSTDKLILDIMYLIFYSTYILESIYCPVSPLIPALVGHQHPGGRICNVCNVHSISLVLGEIRNLFHVALHGRIYVREITYFVFICIYLLHCWIITFSKQTLSAVPLCISSCLLKAFRIERKKWNDPWHATRETLHGTSDTWHVTHGRGWPFLFKISVPKLLQFGCEGF